MSERTGKAKPASDGRGGEAAGGSGLGSGRKGCGRDRHQPGTGSERARLRHGAGSREASRARELALNERVSAVACLISLCFRYPIRLSLSVPYNTTAAASECRSLSWSQWSANAAMYYWLLSMQLAAGQCRTHKRLSSRPRPSEAQKYIALQRTDQAVRHPSL